jgi:iron complex transport system permease protein
MNKKIWLLGIFVFVLLIFSPFWGTIRLNWQSIFDNNSNSFIFWHLRVPRVLLGFVAGSILALSGLICQNLFKNNLATPDLLGISSGAAAGAVISIKFKLYFSFLGISSIYVFSFLGALSAVFFIFLMARMIKNSTIYTFLMSGIAINFFYSSIIVLFQYVFDFSDTFSLVRWLMGGIFVAGYNEILFLAALLLLFLFSIFLFKREFLLISAGEDFAQSKGLNISNFRIYSFFGLSLFVGAVVSTCGPIGFISLVVPHLSRLWGSSRYTETVLFSMLLGGGLLVGADLLARILIAPVDIPVGIVTSLLGAPFFLFLLVSHLKKTN